MTTGSMPQRNFLTGAAQEFSVFPSPSTTSGYKQGGKRKHRFFGKSRHARRRSTVNRSCSSLTSSDGSGSIPRTPTGPTQKVRKTLELAQTQYPTLAVCTNADAIGYVLYSKRAMPVRQHRHGANQRRLTRRQTWLN